MEQADRIITVSNYTKDVILRHYKGIDPNKIVVIHNGICLDKGPKVFLPKKPNFNPKMVLFVGRLTQQKGPDYFVAIANKILAERDDIHFVLAGNGDMLRDLIERVAKLRIGRNIHFTGFLSPEKVQKIYRLASIYVMPSVSEPFGLSCLEALAHNVPTVISRQSGVSEVVQHVLVADFWDVDLMASKILALLKYPCLRSTMTKHATKELRNVTWQRAAEAIIKLYNSM
jgi:glycogen synthase